MYAKIKNWNSIKMDVENWEGWEILGIWQTWSPFQVEVTVTVTEKDCKLERRKVNWKTIDEGNTAGEGFAFRHLVQAFQGALNNTWGFPSKLWLALRNHKFGSSGAGHDTTTTFPQLQYCIVTVMFSSHILGQEERCLRMHALRDILLWIDAILISPVSCDGGVNGSTLQESDPKSLSWWNCIGLDWTRFALIGYPDSDYVQGKPRSKTDHVHVKDGQKHKSHYCTRFKISKGEG